jgi:hypothetical protein
MTTIDSAILAAANTIANNESNGTFAERLSLKMIVIPTMERKPPKRILHWKDS